MDTPTLDIDKLDDFTRAYLVCALWASTDEDGDPLDVHDITDIAAATLAEMVSDCKDFQESHYTDIADNLTGAGNDFWLTRNGHGAGFWDGDWSKEVGQRLTDAAHVYGEYDLYYSHVETIMTERSYSDPSAAHEYALKMRMDSEVYRVIITPTSGKYVVQTWKREGDSKVHSHNETDQYLKTSV